MNIDLDKALVFKSRQEWRKWLAKNHDKKHEALIIHYRKSSSKQTLSHIEAVEEALCFGWIDSILRRVDDERFVLKYTPRKPKSVWSKINRDKAEKLIKTGKMTPAGLVKIEEAKNNSLWDSAYTNRVRDEMPDDLEEALRQNKTAWQNFHQFANSYRNMYVGWVTAAKTEVTRKKRITEIIYRSERKIKPGIDTTYYSLLQKND